MNDQPQATQTASSIERSARNFVQTHGRARVTILAGGIAAAIGTLLPFATTRGIFGNTSSTALIQAGIYGLILLLLPIALGVFPIMRKADRRTNVVAFGVSSGLFGAFLSAWIVASGALSSVGLPAGDLAAGFYLTLLGYAATTIGYYQIITQAD